MKNIAKSYQQFLQLTEDNFFKELEKLRNKYGYDQIFVAYSIPEDNESSMWASSSNTISDGMIDYIEKTIEPMRERLR